MNFEGACYLGTVSWLSCGLNDEMLFKSYRIFVLDFGKELLFVMLYILVWFRVMRQRT